MRRILMRGLGAADVAAKAAIHTTLASPGGRGGLIAADALGHSAFSFNTTGMSRGIASSGGERRIDLFR